MNLIEIGKEVVLKGIVKAKNFDNAHVQIGSKVLVVSHNEANKLKGIIKHISGDFLYVQLKSKVFLINSSELLN